MRILFAGNKSRGLRCLEAVQKEGHEILCVLAHAPSRAGESIPFAVEAQKRGFKVLQPANVNDPAVLRTLGDFKPDLTILAGYGPIVGEAFIRLPKKGCLNLHGGKLPEFRGSSPMNWALIKGEKTFTLSVIQVDIGVDTGDVLIDRTFPIAGTDSITEVSKQADKIFPELLVEVVRQLEAGTLKPRKQDDSTSAYYPLRFPEDGFILWDLFSAEEVHDRIRALADPFPGAFTVWKNRKMKLLSSRLTERPFHGEPGRIYRKSDKGILVCAKDRCLWIERAVFENDGSSALETLARYDRLPTVREAAMNFYLTGVPQPC